MIYYVMLCYVILYYVILYYIILYYIISYHIISYYIILYYIILYYIILYYIILYFIILYYIILYYIINRLPQESFHGELQAAFRHRVPGRPESTRAWLLSCNGLKGLASRDSPWCTLCCGPREFRYRLPATDRQTIPW